MLTSLESIRGRKKRAPRSACGTLRWLGRKRRGIDAHMRTVRILVRGQRMISLVHVPVQEVEALVVSMCFEHADHLQLNNGLVDVCAAPLACTLLLLARKRREKKRSGGSIRHSLVRPCVEFLLPLQVCIHSCVYTHTCVGSHPEDFGGGGLARTRTSGYARGNESSRTHTSDRRAGMGITCHAASTLGGCAGCGVDAFGGEDATPERKESPSSPSKKLSVA